MSTAIGNLKIRLNIPSIDQPPLVDVNFRTLFRMLEPKLIIDIINAMLCEIPILLLSNSIDILTPCVEAVHTLLYPLKWPFIYIPLLPLSLTCIVFYCNVFLL